jgi:hypothetical protein
MSITTEQRASLRQEFETTAHRPPVDLKIFRELVRRAPSSAWLAMARFTPIAAGLPPAVAEEAAPPAKDFWFGLYLVDPSAASVEVLGKVRGGPRTWTNLDSMSDFVEGFLESTDLKGRICVHVV